jgi:hypothetical protein
MTMNTVQRWGYASLAAVFCMVPAAQAATPADLLAAYTAQAGGVPPSPERGQRLFTTNFGRPLDWSCSSCHGDVPVKPGRDEVSEKPIAPLAPAANPARFTDMRRVEAKFKLNCKDIVGRDCSAGEKADVISWLLTLKP